MRFVSKRAYEKTCAQITQMEIVQAQNERLLAELQGLYASGLGIKTPAVEPVEREPESRTDHMGRTYWFLKEFKSGYGTREEKLVVSRDEGNLVASLCEDGMHAPVFDIDYDAELIPSKTPGHFHLYLNMKCSSDAYMKVLDAMAEAGMVEKNYARASRIQGKGMLRLPPDGGPSGEAVRKLAEKIRETGNPFPDLT